MNVHNNFSEEQTQTANKLIKRHVNSSVAKKMQISGTSSHVILVG